MKQRKYSGFMTVAFCVFIFANCLLSIVFPDITFSEFENRTLAGLPEFSLAELLGGSFNADFEKYMEDQFVARNIWVGLKALSERARGISENNGVYFAKDNYLIEKFDDVDFEQLDKNINSIRKFAELVNYTNSGSTVPKDGVMNVYFMPVPTASCILSTKLPPYAVNADQKEILEYIWNGLPPEVKKIDLVKVLARLNDQYIYYRTDHHWTTKGAYAGYAALAESMGIKPAAGSCFRQENVTSSFYGTLYSKAAAVWTEPDDIILYFPPGAKTDFTVTIKDNGKVIEGVYDMSFLDKKDKYSVFLGGNNALVVIRNKTKTRAADRRVLVIKDSYAHNLVPFLANDFSEIHMADLRYLKIDLKTYCKQNSIDDVVFIYSIPNFANDNNLIWLNAF